MSDPSLVGPMPRCALLGLLVALLLAALAAGCTVLAPIKEGSGLSFHDAEPRGQETALAWRSDAVLTAAFTAEMHRATQMRASDFLGNVSPEVFVPDDVVGDGRAPAWALVYASSANPVLQRLLVVVASNGTIRTSANPPIPWDAPPLGHASLDSTDIARIAWTTGDMADAAEEGWTMMIDAKPAAHPGFHGAPRWRLDPLERIVGLHPLDVDGATGSVAPFTRHERPAGPCTGPGDAPQVEEPRRMWSWFDTSAVGTTDHCISVPTAGKLALNVSWVNGGLEVIRAPPGAAWVARLVAPDGASLPEHAEPAGEVAWDVPSPGPYRLLVRLHADDATTARQVVALD